MLKNLFRRWQKPTPEALQATVPPEVAAPPSIADQPIETPAPKKYFAEVGEYFPWKGFMFKVAEVNDRGFVAIAAGVTKKRAESLRELRKKNAEQLKKLQEDHQNEGKS